MADVLIINMWNSEVGKTSESNYIVLKNIFEANFKLYNKNAAKKLLFLIRNFENVGNNEEKTITTLEREVKLIWR
jgi:hypothetical protein